MITAHMTNQSHTTTDGDILALSRRCRKEEEECNEQYNEFHRNELQFRCAASGVHAMGAMLHCNVLMLKMVQQF
jgi:hypothetical protein